MNYGDSINKILKFCIREGIPLSPKEIGTYLIVSHILTMTDSDPKAQADTRAYMIQQISDVMAQITMSIAASHSFDNPNPSETVH
jgi:hypothetical protein